MSNFIVSGFNQIYDRVATTFGDSVEAKRVGPARPAPVEVQPDPEPAAEAPAAPAAKDGYQAQPAAPTAFVPKAAATTFQVPAKTSAASAVKPVQSLRSTPPSVAEINKRFARSMEAARQNPGLVQNPKMMEKVIQLLRNDHIDALATTAALTGNHELMGELQTYQQASRSVQSGAMQARNPGLNPTKATPGQKEATKAHLDNMLYDDLLADLPVAQ